MAEQKVYFGSLGPMLYDDTDLIDDVDGDFAGESYHGITTSGQMIVGGAPAGDYELLRKIDLLNLMYPIGHIWISATVTNPGTIVGGTWVAVTGYFLVGYKNGDADFGVAGVTGGGKTHTHDVDPAAVNSGGPDATVTVDRNADGLTLAVAKNDHVHSVNVGNTTSGVNSALPPFKVYYIFERTA
jgi:hypothetical protein